MNKGFATLFAVIIVGAVTLTVIFTLALLTLSSSRTTSAFSSSFRAKAVANACAEQGLMEIRNNSNYVGTGSLTLGGQGCTFTVVNTGGSTREIQAVSTVNIFSRKVKVTISEISPKIIISSWKEVGDLSGSSCICTDWADVSCGNLTCTADQMYQERTCNTTGCDLEQRCVSGHTSCQSDYGAYWKLDENTGLVANDILHNNQGAIYNAVWTNDAIIGSALNFNGTAYVGILNSNSLNIASNQLTLEAWIKWNVVPQTASAWANIINKNNDNEWQLQHNSTNDKIEFALRTSIARKNITSVRTIQKDGWYHVVGTYDGANMKLYLNGVLESSINQTGNITVSASNVSIGQSVNNSRRFRGVIDEVRILDFVLTPEEVLARYNETRLDSCNCTPWVDNACGINSCSFYQSYQTRSCTPVACEIETRCFLDQQICSVPAGAYWKFDENSGTITSDSMNGNASTLVGTSWTNDSISLKALNFDGTAYVNVVNNGSLNIEGSKLTLEAWVKWGVEPDVWAAQNMPNNQWANIINKNNDTEWQMQHGPNNKNFEFALNTDTGRSYMISNATISKDVWYYVVGTYDGVQMKLFVNGVLDKTVSKTGNLVFSSSNVNLGRRVGGDRYFNGKLDEIRILDTVLSEAIILERYNSILLEKNTLKGLWKLDENTGTTVNNSVNSNNGTIAGATWSSGAISNSGLSFDGVNDNVNIPNNSAFDIEQNITVMSWVKASENKTSRIIQKGDWDGWGLYQDLWAGWKVSIYNQDNTGYSMDWGSGRPVLGQWYHLAYTYDGSILKLYVDGVLKNSLSISGKLKINTRPISFGSDNGNQKFFNGLIDEVYLYSRTLSATEIQNYYNQSK